MAEQVKTDSTAQGNHRHSRAEMFKKMKQTKDSIDNVILQLQKDSLSISKDYGVLQKENASLKLQIKDLQATINQMEVTKDSLINEVQVAQSRESPIVAITSPSGCAVLIVLILALTAIALKKGFSISKGDTKLSVGDKGKDQE